MCRFLLEIEVASPGGSDSDAIAGRMLISETKNLNKSPKVKEVAGEGNSNPDAIVGRIIFTSWTREMTLLSKGTVPSKWREDMKAVWIRKCKIVHFDKVVGEYKLRYLCGYERMVHEADMSAIMDKHRDFSKATHLNILAMVNDAQQEEVDLHNKWNTTYGSGRFTPSQPGAHSLPPSGDDTCDVAPLTIKRAKKKGETASGLATKKKKFRSRAGVGDKLNITNSVRVLPVKRASAINVVSSSSNCGSSSNTSPNNVLLSAAVVVNVTEDDFSADTNCGSSSNTSPNNGLLTAPVVVSAPEEGPNESSNVHVVQSVDFSADTFPLHPNNDNTSCWINTGMQVIC